MDKIALVTAIVGSIVTVGTLANAVWQYRRKVHLEIFRTYADKYNKILSPDVYEKWVGALRGEQHLWAELNPTMIQYLNLVWEEAYLSQSGAIPIQLWRIWLPETGRCFRQILRRTPQTRTASTFRLTCHLANPHQGRNYR